MKNLNDYKEDLYKCSRCGLCQSVCPVYKATLNECAVSKGKFNMLNGVLKGDLDINSKIKSYLDLCTGCNACKDFCPSDIDARKIFMAAKNEYYETCKISFGSRFLTSISLFNFVLHFISVLGFCYRFLQLHKLVRLFAPLLRKMGLMGKRVLLGDFLLSNKFVSKKLPQRIKTDSKQKKIVFFDGCINKYINNESKLAVSYLLKKSGFKLVSKDFKCCGVSYLNDGNLNKFKTIAKQNIEKMDVGSDYILTDCASCYDVLKQYANFVDDDRQQLAFDLSNKVVSPLDLLKGLKYSCVANKDLKVAVHVPCHESYDIAGFVKGIQGIQYIDVEDYDKCCGFSGSFALKYQDVSRKISKQKAQNYLNAKVDIVLTTCPACMLGLEQGFLELSDSKRPQVMNLYIFLAQYCQQIV